ncbi:hypothetical protein EV08_0859 [Prochlorococcus marinus str. SS2]|nr:hypothetical protein EV08_0859 [Prochlorococcus marinus str. SS2]KGG23966.1 hypothetical protein EV09_0570 [Prochlorococcus marinus str. SS35]
MASCLSISISAAKKKIDLAAARKGARDLSSRKEIAAKLLEEAIKYSSSNETTIANQLDNLLEALAEEENFMVED